MERVEWCPPQIHVHPGPRYVTSWDTGSVQVSLVRDLEMRSSWMTWVGPQAMTGVLLEEEAPERQAAG